MKALFAIRFRPRTKQRVWPHNTDEEGWVLDSGLMNEDRLYFPSMQDAKRFGDLSYPRAGIGSKSYELWDVIRID